MMKISIQKMNCALGRAAVLLSSKAMPSVAPSSSSPSASSNAETVWLNNFRVPVSPNLLPSLSLATANQQQITKHKIGLALKKFQSHATDSGSASVQIAVMTEKILNMARHAAMHKKDKHSNRGFQVNRL